MSGGVLIVAGGTGGHVFPALAAADVLVRRGVPLFWLGTPSGLESRLVPAAGHRLETVTVKGLRGNGWLGWLQAPWMVLRATWQAMRVMRRERPDVVLGMGGYVAGPAGLAAWLLRRPLVIHEQNARPGLTNKLLVPFARYVLTGLDAPLAASGKRRFVGNPIRAEIAALPVPSKRYAGREGRARLLVIGGSLGARTLNQRLPQALAMLAQGERPEVLHQAGARTLQMAVDAYAQAGVQADVREFIDDMAEAYQWCDLVICRAGALTVSELAAAGLPAILVPYPYAVDDHQTANAEFLCRAGGAEQRADAELDAQWLAARLRTLLGDRARLQAMAEASRSVGRPAAAEQVADLCLEVAA